MTAGPEQDGKQEQAPWNGYIPAPLSHVYILHESDPYGFAAFTIPRAFADPEAAKGIAAEHVGPLAEWLPFGRR